LINDLFPGVTADRVG
jgi:dynein heavy chain